MIKQLFFFLAFNIFGIGVFAQNLTWATAMGGTNPDEGFSVVTDPSGNIYTTGNFYGTVDFDPGAGIYNLTSAGITDVFISKTDPAGNFIWARSIGSTDYDYGNAITMDGSGNIFVTGYFNFTVDFDPGAGIFNLTSSGTNDAYVLKLDNSGNFVWAKRFGAGSSDEGASIITDASGNVYTAGTFYGTVDFDPSATVFNLSSGSNSGAFVQKLDNSGNFVFAKNFNGFLSEGRGITLDASGNIYATGNYNGTVDFDPGAGVMNLTSVGADDIFIAKLNALGNFVWAKSVGSSTWDYGYSVNVDGSGNVYTSGTYGAAADFDPGAGTVNFSNAGQNDIFVLKLDASGNYIWAVSFGGSGSDYGLTSKLDAFGNLYAAGSFAGTVDFDPGVGVNNLVSNGNDDAFIVKLDPSGNYIWAQGIGAAIYDRYRGITVDGANNLITTGSFFNTVDFDPNAPVVNLTSVGSSDIFISKISCMPGLAGAVSGPPALCQGGASGNYSIPPVSGATGYSWTVPGGATIISGQNTPNINITIGASSGMVVVTPTNSCGSSPSVSLSVTSATSPTITSSASPGFICPGGTSTLSASGPLLLDQQSTSGVTTGFWIGTATGQQSFIAGLSGVLKKVRVHTATYGSATTITLKVYSGPVGGGSLLTTVSYGKGTNTNSWDDVILPGGGVSVSSGNPYYIEILAGSQIDWIYRNVNVYLNGQAWRGGISYNYDYNFETYIDQNTYLWNPGGAPTQNFVASPPSTTNYTVTVTNAAGCPNTQTVNLNVNPVINASSVVTNISCNGGTNGAVNLTPSGGVPPYTFVWSNGPVTEDIINLSPGTYNVTITDASGCTKPASAVVTQPGLLVANSAITTTINCNGGSGVISVTASGGTPSYSGTGSFTVTAGTYTYNVTDANGCVKTTSITVTQPAPFTINVNAPTSICFGGSTTLSATGASTYTWNPGGLTGANVNVTPVSTTVYTATGTSSLGCVATNSTTVTVNPNPTVTVSSSTICLGSTTTLTASGATTYSWNTGATTASIAVSPGSTTNYTVTGTNTFGCTNTKTTSVTVNLLPAITTSASPTSICAGSSSNLTAAGATTYTWNPGGIVGSAVTVSPASTTVYTVTGTNSNGCVNTQTINLTVNSLPIITASSSTNAICAGSNATLTGGGATTYTWNPGALTGVSIVVSPGSTTQYTVTGTNAFGCVNTQTVNLTVNPLPTLTLSASPATMCIGATSTLTGTGATSYTWNPGGFSGSVIIDAPSGSTEYTVTGTNGFGCVNTQTVDLTVNPLPTLTVAASPAIICVGASATLTGAGATTYTWNPGALTGSVTTVSPGSTTIYTVTGTNSNGCVNTQTVSLTVNPLPVISAAASPSAICIGSTATLTGTGAATYTWNPGVLTGSATVVSPASTTQYTATGTDSNGCVNTQTVNLTVNALPTLTASASPATICVGATSTLTGTGANTYTWNPGSLTGSIVSVSPGSTTIYTLTGTNANGCVNTKTVNLTVNPLPTLTLAVSPATICVGATATLTGTGASTYTWNPGALTGSTIAVSPGSTTIYTATGTNSNGCVNTRTVNLTVNPLPTLTAAVSPTVICIGSTATLTGTGATTYTWNPGVLTGSSVSVSPGSTTVYTVTGTNVNSCVNTQTVSLTVNPLPTLTVAASPATICIGAASTLTATGASTYTWNPGGLTGSSVSVSPGSTTIYTITGTNSNGCVNTRTLNLTINPLPTLTAVASPTAICVGATSTLTATGAATYTWNPGALTGSVTSVSPGTTTQYTVIGTNTNGCINTQTVNLTVNPLPTLTITASPTAICIGSTATLTGTGAVTYTWNPGGLTGTTINVSPASSTIYTVTGTNSSGCVQTETISLTVNALPIVSAATSSSAICAGDTATLTAGGAVTYLWDNGASTAVVTVTPGSLTIYTVTGTDGNNCVNTETVSITVNALPVVSATSSSSAICIGATATLTGSGATSYTWEPGTLTGAGVFVSPSSTTDYTVTGIDGNSCVNTQTLSLTVNSLPVVTIGASSAAICIGATATFTAAGANSYLWDTGASTSIIAVSPSSSVIYTVTGTDGNNCVNTETVGLTVNPLPVVTAASSPTAICTGETATLTAGGASTYIWDTGATGNNITVSPVSNTIYTVTGTDVYNCVNSETVSVTVNSLPVITAISSSTAICTGATATLTATGAVSYTWNPGVLTGTTISVSPSSSTIYTLTGANGSGCVQTETVSLTVNALPVVTANSTASVVCNGQPVTLTGAGALSYGWDNGVVDGVAFIPPGSGTYIVTGTDVNGCVGMDTTFVNVNSLPVVIAGATSTAVCSGNFASLTGSGAATYTWNPGALTGATVTVNPSSNTVYTVSGTDGAGCVNTETISLTVNPLPIVTAAGSPTAICAGQTSTLTAAGAVSYTWNPGGLTGVSIAVSPSSTTAYTVLGVDGSGCTNTGNISLSVSTNPTVTVVSSPSVICEGQTAVLTASGANTYSWNTGATTFSASVSPTSTAIYTVTGTNGTNCTHTETITLTVNINPTVTIASSPSAICAGQSSTLTASGANTYLWNTGAGTSAITVTPASTTVFTVTGTNSTNCTHTETISLTVNALPVISVSPSGTTICQGQSQLLQVSGATSYTWSGSGSVSNSITVSPTVSTTYTVTGMDANSCVNTATALVNTASQPVVSVNSPSTNVCMGYTMTVVASGASTYTWSNGATTSSITVQPFSNVTYSVIGSNGGSCRDTAFLPLTVLPLPSVSASASNSLICAGNTVSLTAGGTAVNFLWQPGNLSGANQVVQMSTPTTFTAYGQGSNGCAFFSTTFVDVPSASAIVTAVTPTAVCAGDSAMLSVSGATVSLWSGNAVPNTSVVMPFNNTTYTFTAIDGSGCTSDLSFTVLMRSDCDEVVVYNGFTPNGDGINDVWLIDNIEKFPNNKVAVYNRWGNKIFQTTNYNNTDNAWDGKSNGQAISAGTYIYVIVDESEKLIKKGWLEITN